MKDLNNKKDGFEVHPKLKICKKAIIFLFLKKTHGDTGNFCRSYPGVRETCFRAGHQHKNINFRKVGQLCHIGLAQQEGVTPFAGPPHRLAQALHDERKIPAAQRPHQNSHALGVPLLELTARVASLEDAFLELTDSDQQYKVGGDR